MLQIERALDLLKNRSAEWYAYTISGLDKIEEAPALLSGFVRVQTRTYVSSQETAFFAGGGETALIWLAGVFVHEACHVYRYEAGLVPGGLEGERNCLELQVEALEIIDPRDRFQRYLREVLANYDNVEYQWWWR